MSLLSLQMSPFERRCKARLIRKAIWSGHNPKTMIAAAQECEVSRAHAYRILEELHAWEEKTTFKDEIADIDAQLRAMPGHEGGWYAEGPERWHLVGGNLTLAYAHGELPPELDRRDAQEDISDPLLR